MPAAQGNWREDWEVLIRGLGALPPGARLTFAEGLEAEVVDRAERGAARLRFTGSAPGGVLALSEAIGAVPLPPYIEAARKRAGSVPPPSHQDDRARYQTVYARSPGAVAAPTAGLHFTAPLLEEVTAAGHEIACVTLHVGPGTFRPVETDDPRGHKMHPEAYYIPEQTAAAIRRARAHGRPVVAVGTTVVRALETAAGVDGVTAGSGSTDLFLLPGAPFRVVTDLITNFHLPRSTLLMLVAAFAGRERVLDAYQHAVAASYRFYSYGDAMFIRGAEHPEVA